MNKASVELTIRYGFYGEQSKTVILPISEELTRELMTGVELSNKPFSLMLASPGMMGGEGDAITIRNRTFKMRREIAESISKLMVPVLLEAFGVNDELDGYKVENLSSEEKTYQKSRGRL